MFSYIYIYLSLFNFPYSKLFNIYDCPADNLAEFQLTSGVDIQRTSGELPAHPTGRQGFGTESLKQDLGLGFETGFWAQNLGIGKDGNSASAVYKKIAKPYRVGVRVVAGFK